MCGSSYSFAASGGCWCSGNLCCRHPEIPCKQPMLSAGLHQVGSKCNISWTLGLASKHELWLRLDHLSTLSFVCQDLFSLFLYRNDFFQHISLHSCWLSVPWMKQKVSGVNKLFKYILWVCVYCLHLPYMISNVITNIHLKKQVHIYCIRFCLGFLLLLLFGFL